MATNKPAKLGSATNRILEILKAEEPAAQASILKEVFTEITKERVLAFMQISDQKDYQAKALDSLYQISPNIVETTQKMKLDADRNNSLQR